MSANPVLEPLMLAERQAGEIAKILRQSHQDAFTEWLSLRLPDQHTEFMRYLAAQPNTREMLVEWREHQSYKKLIPPGRRPEERAHFIGDFELLISVASSAVSEPLEEQVSEAIHLESSDSNTYVPSVSSPATLIPPTVGADEMEKLMVLAGRAQYLAWLRDRKRVTQAEYVAQLNSLRREYGLDPIDE